MRGHHLRKVLQHLGEAHLAHLGVQQLEAHMKVFGLGRHRHTARSHALALTRTHSSPWWFASRTHVSARALTRIQAAPTQRNGLCGLIEGQWSL
jgi:hypothetical protein